MKMEEKLNARRRKKYEHDLEMFFSFSFSLVNHSPRHSQDESIFYEFTICFYQSSITNSSSFHLFSLSLSFLHNMNNSYEFYLTFVCTFSSLYFTAGCVCMSIQACRYLFLLFHIYYKYTMRIVIN